MSPSRSNTICFPSGLTSTFIQVPSDVSKSQLGRRSEVGVDIPLVCGLLLRVRWRDEQCEKRNQRTNGEASAHHWVTSFCVLCSVLCCVICSVTWFIIKTSPQVPARDRPVGPPRFTELPQAFRSRFLSQAIGLLDRVHDPEVADGKDVGALQAEDEEHLRRPATDAFHLRQRGNDLFVGHSVDVIERHARQSAPSHTDRAGSSPSDG